MPSLRRVLPLTAFSTLGLFGCRGGSPEPAVTPPIAPTVAPSAWAAAPDASMAPDAATAGNSIAVEAAQITSRAVPIPGATPPLSFDYLATDRSAGRIYLAVGNTGSLDVFDTATGTFARVDGFKTAEKEWKGKRRVLGPSAAAVGDGVVYVGNRATSEICVVDVKTWKRGQCLKLPTSTDGVAYVASVKEVWVTTPEDQSLTVLDAAKPAALKPKTVIKLPGDTEGYAVDEDHGLFFTNLEDKGSALAVDVRTHTLRATWNPGCGSAGPRGVAVDSTRGFLFVACTDHVQVLDATRDGAPLGRVETGAGVDNLDYVAANGLLYAAAAKAAKITVARFDEKGNPTVVATGATAVGSRNAVADGNGNAYVPDPGAATLLILGGARVR